MIWQFYAFNNSNKFFLWIFNLRFHNTRTLFVNNCSKGVKSTTWSQRGDVNNFTLLIRESIRISMAWFLCVPILFKSSRFGYTSGRSSWDSLDRSGSLYPNFMLEPITMTGQSILGLSLDQKIIPQSKADKFWSCFFNSVRIIPLMGLRA